jgi:SAM-dependent methyltransferase
MASSTEHLYTEKADDYFSSARVEIEPLVPRSISRVLDVGCGSGATSLWMKSIRDVKFSAGIELNAEAGANAARVLDDVFVGDIQNASGKFLPKSFDLILALDVLEHLVDPWAAVAQLTKLLSGGGAIIASIPNIGHYSVAFPLVGGNFDYAKDGILDRTHLRFFVEQTAIDLMTSSGLVVDQVEYVMKLPTARLRWYLKKYRLQKFIGRLPLDRLLKYQFLIRARTPVK